MIAGWMTGSFVVIALAIEGAAGSVRSMSWIEFDPLLRKHTPLWIARFVKESGERSSVLVTMRIGDDTSIVSNSDPALLRT